MYDNVNEIIIEPQEKTNPSYEFTDEPIQLVYIEDGMFEPTTQAINLLSALKWELFNFYLKLFSTILKFIIYYYF